MTVECLWSLQLATYQDIDESPIHGLCFDLHPPELVYLCNALGSADGQVVVVAKSGFLARVCDLEHVLRLVRSRVGR